MLGVSRSLLIGYFLLFCQLLGLCHAEDYDGPTQLERLDHVPHDLLGKDDAHQMHMPDPMRNLNYHFVKIEGKPQGSVRAPTEAFVEELRRRKVDTVCFLDPVSSDEHRIIQFFESRGFKVQTEFRNEFNELINKEPSQKLHSNVKLSQFLEEGTYTGVLFYETKGNTKTATVFSRIWGYESVRLFDATGRAFWSQSIQRIRIRPLFLQLLFGITEKQAKEAVKAERIIVNSSSPYRPLWDHGRRNRFDAEGRTFVPRKSMVPEISLPPMSRGPVTAADAAVVREYLAELRSRDARNPPWKLVQGAAGGQPVHNPPGGPPIHVAAGGQPSSSHARPDTHGQDKPNEGPPKKIWRPWDDAADAAVLQTGTSSKDTAQSRNPPDGVEGQSSASHNRHDESNAEPKQLASEPERHDTGSEPEHNNCKRDQACHRRTFKTQCQLFRRGNSLYRRARGGGRGQSGARGSSSQGYQSNYGQGYRLSSSRSRGSSAARASSPQRPGVDSGDSFPEYRGGEFWENAGRGSEKSAARPSPANGQSRANPSRGGKSNYCVADDLSNLAAEAFLFAIDMAAKAERPGSSGSNGNNGPKDTNNGPTWEPEQLDDKNTPDAPFWQPPKSIVDSKVPPAVAEWVEKYKKMRVQGEKALDDLIPQVMEDRDFAYKTYYLQDRTLSIILKNDLQISCDAPSGTSTDIDLDTCSFAPLPQAQDYAAEEVERKKAKSEEGILDVADDERPQA
ncbi:hypothetical protein DCS_06845 [Drechmeria coniospora]|uniref:Uncharacterized protein n=1 Tax=Drechmeria coniospora TaxID=98403 RepID=A0A151GCW0_DRECN|nr:hypothetical protein DCS_06845 [Drechmeria coniospora]KYK54884.1 hypothetical protein DCS_06845 [Drechmeria coniospora]